MDILAIAFVLWIAGMHYSYGVKLLENLKTQNIKVANQIVNKHNALRRGVIPKASDMLKMEWSQEAADNAAKWAEACFYGHSPTEQRVIPECSCGENLLLSSYPMTWPIVIQNWYDERRFFIYGKGGVDGQTVGHYTQIVEATSQYIGCAVALCDGSFYYVCQYCPPGNQAHRLETPYTAGNPCSNCAAVYSSKCDDGLCINQCLFKDRAQNCQEMKSRCLYTGSWCEATCKCGIGDTDHRTN